MKYTYTIISLFIFLIAGKTQYCEWLGTGNSNWHDPTNWSCGNVPDTSDLVVIAETGLNDTVNIMSTAGADNLFIDGAGVVLNIGEDRFLRITDHVAVGYGAKVYNQGKIFVFTDNIAGIFIDPDGYFENAAGATLSVHSNGSLDYGVWVGSFFGAGYLVNNGTINGSAANIAELYIYDGLYSGDGVNDGQLLIEGSGATISPGSSPGILTTEIFNANANSKYIAEIDGIAGPGFPGGNDLIFSLLTAHLAGDLDVLLNYSPSVGDSYILISCGLDCTGTFSNVNLPAPPNGTSWKLDYNSTDVTLSLEDAPLPIEWKSFNVIKTDKNLALVLWETATELNNEKFIIERSVDGIDWKTIADIPGSNKVTGNSYSFTDNTILSGIQYYRIQQIDFDQSKSISEVKSLLFNETNSYPLIFPNPTSDLLNISSEMEGELSIFNYAHELLYSNTINKEMKLNTSFLTPGMYIIQIQTLDKLFQKAFIKK